MLVTQIIMFEITRNKMIKENNFSWFLAFDKPFHYNRVGYMFFLCLVCYMITSEDPIFSVNWFIYFFVFLAVGIIGDAIAQYVTLKYGKMRLKKQIEDTNGVKEELKNIDINIIDESYEISEPQYSELDILRKYVQDDTHLAFLSVDGGKFARKTNIITEATFVVEPYGDIEKVKADLSDLPYTVVQLTQNKQMPFKDEKIDVVMCQFSNYDKTEIYRILKNDGYFIVHQNGTNNYKELFKMYVPFKIKGVWDVFNCANSLQDLKMQVMERYEEYGSIRFKTVESMITYFKDISPDFINIEKYQRFYIEALNSIKQKGFYELTTHRFIVVAKK